MAVTITSDLVEAYSLCPRKAFLLMMGATPDPGPHDYELVIREQAEANGQAHRVRLAKAGEVVSFSSPADLAAGRDVLADAELATGVLRLDLKQAYWDSALEHHPCNFRLSGKGFPRGLSISSERHSEFHRFCFCLVS